eukprot:732983-Ditylum_brightwellii.AAC.1
MDNRCRESRTANVNTPTELKTQERTTNQTSNVTMLPPDTAKDSPHKDRKPKLLDHIYTIHNTLSNDTNRKTPYRSNQDNILSATKSAAIRHHNMTYLTTITRSIGIIHPSRVDISTNNTNRGERQQQHQKSESAHKKNNK